MKTSYIAAIVIVLLIAGGAWWWSMKQSATATPSGVEQTSGTAPTAPSVDTTNTSPTPTTGTVNTQTTTTITPTPASAPAAQHFTVHGNDASADLTTITVKKGTPVSITFGADSGTTYHGGLDFRSSVLSTGTIAPGATKTVTFTADQSFAFTPYWPASNVAKPYKIAVVVTP
jgi:cytoskeletal protein RodZ